MKLKKNGKTKKYDKSLKNVKTKINLLLKHITREHKMDVHFPEGNQTGL